MSYKIQPVPVKMNYELPEMINEPMKVSPAQLISTLLQYENDENNNLIQILGIVRPSKSSQTSITSLIRGLFTKNKALLKILGHYSTVIGQVPDINDQKQIFKNFINEFILWVEDGILVLVTKYKECLKSSDLAENAANDSTYFNKPLMHLSNYIQFIETSLCVIRNPYIVDQLKSFSSGCQQVLDDYISFIENSKLDNINFNNVQLFGEPSSSRLHADNVCSYFKITQIVERTKSECLVLENSKHKYHIELLLVNLNGLATQSYNALAVLLTSERDSSRSLMFPPFRINELSLSYSNSKCQLILQSLKLTQAASNSDTLIISCPSEDFLASWVRKLSTIFPIEDSKSPVNPNFLIKLNENSPTIKMAGLGIDTLSDCSQISLSDEESPSESKAPFTELISSPSLKAPTLQVPGSSSSSNGPRSNSVLSVASSVEFHQPRIPQFVKVNTASPTSLRSAASSESYSSHKNQPFMSNNNLHVQSIPTGVAVSAAEANRPVSSSAEIEEDAMETDDKENYDPLTMHQNASVPNISTKKDTGIYKAATGSEIDLSNFGRNHNPSFSVHRGLSDMVTKEDRPKSKLFGFFKKANKSPRLALPSATPKTTKPASHNPKDLKINTQIPMESDSDTIPLSGNSMVSSGSTLSQNTTGNKSFTEHKNASGSAFALPSSTSTYFFKQYKKDGISNSTDSIHEEDLKIPQQFKDIINDDNSIDFYISPSSPKAMKVSKWKAKYGKWEMLTINENVFLKVVVNYDQHSAWLIFFKEEYDSKYDEIVDKPILLLNINNETDIMQSAALDVQIASRNAITGDNMLIMIRCQTNSLGQEIVGAVRNVKGVLAPKKLRHKGSQDSSLAGSKQTIASSIMDLAPSKAAGASKSSTLTSVNSSLEDVNSKPANGVSQLTRDLSLVSISSENITNATILSNPENTKLLVLNQMTVRLQKQLEGHDQIANPSSWKILSMYSLSVHLISDSFTDKNYYSFALESLDSSESYAPYKWLICEDDKQERIAKIGKAGLLVNVSDTELFMIECKGKREFKELYDVF